MITIDLRTNKLKLNDFHNVKITVLDRWYSYDGLDRAPNVTDHNNQRTNIILFDMVPLILQCRADSGSHFVTRDPSDPSVKWLMTHMTHDPYLTS